MNALILAALLSQQILPSDTITAYTSLIPLIEDEELSEVINDPRGIWYDSSIGVMVQAGPNIDWGGTFGGRLGVVDGNQVNTLREFFPWQMFPGGTHRSKGVVTFKKFLLPSRSTEGANSLVGGAPTGSQSTLAYWPVVIFPAALEGLTNPNNTVLGFDWLFPKGSVLIEFIGTTYKDTTHVQLIRLRIKELNSWTFESLAPYRTEQEYMLAISRLRPGFAPPRSKVTKLGIVDGMPGNSNFGTSRGEAFSMSSNMHTLAPLEDELVEELLAVPFKNCFGYEWTEDCAAPTTTSPFHIVPHNYLGAFIKLETNSCRRCHQDCGASARRFGGSARGWMTGGSEGTIVWHPVETSSLRRIPSAGFELRREWLDNGVIAMYDPAIHPSSVYQRVGK